MAPRTVQGYGQAFLFSEDQKLYWCNMFALGVDPHYLRNPKLWPKNPANFRDVFEEMFGLAVQAVKMNYYPSCTILDIVMGLSHHSDGSAITVLQQGKDSSVGLQILKNNTRVPVQSIPVQSIANALIINIGDTIESNRFKQMEDYKSVEHRASTQKEKDRVSIVTFFAPSYDIELGPMHA